MFQRYNIRDFTTLMEIEKKSSQYTSFERKRYGEFRHELKSTIFKHAYFNGYFNDVGLSEEDMNLIIGGYSPIRVSPTGEETTLFTIHHIKPLICGGETISSNLIPLPKNFHNFLHERVIDPQIKDLKVGDQKVLVAIPDFSKISLSMMMDPGFRIQYHKFLVDEYHMLPEEFNKNGRKNDRQFIANWYLNNFGPRK